MILKSFSMMIFIPTTTSTTNNKQSHGAAAVDLFWLRVITSNKFHALSEISSKIENYSRNTFDIAIFAK
jgi:hypothetical protein